MIDLHTHLIPGVDDGSKSFEESLRILRGLEKQGITDLFLTPHYIKGTKSVSRRFENMSIYNLLRAKARHENIRINLYLGNEIYIDRDIEALLKHGDVSSLGNSEYLLIELPMSGEYDGYLSIFKDLMNKGYKVVFAHPERYKTLQKDYETLVGLSQGGILFQCNLGSIVGQYGQSAKKIVKKLAKDDLIFCFGTDIHHEKDYDEIKKAEEKLEKIYKPERLEQILEKNPRQIIESMLK